MSSEGPPNLSPAAQDYARLWGESTARALGQLQGTTFTPTPQTPAPAPAPSKPTGSAELPPAVPLEDVSLHFKVSGRLTGEQLFRVSKADGIRLAQMLMAEPLDAAAAFSEGYADALNEIFRQFAGLSASACKIAYGGEVQFLLEAVETTAWKEASTAVWSFTAPQVAPIQWTLILSPELLAALEAAQETKSSPSPAQSVAPEAAASTAAPQTGPPRGPNFTPPPPPTASAKPTPSAPNPSGVEGGAPGSNLDLLLDVVLEATLRFGQREMLLRDILELHPGSVVELNRRIQEPAELLVAGRVIAHGEVVIVDGSYGLRITEVAQPQQRLESVEA
jgi:flagellar motor switch protein FliN